MDPCYYFDEETPAAGGKQTIEPQDWLPLVLEGAALALLFAASALGLLRGEHCA